MKRTEDSARPLVIKNDNPIAAWSDVSVIDRRHCIFMSVRCPNRKRDKRDALQPLPDLVDHA
jgi:hypothetical protein